MTRSETLFMEAYLRSSEERNLLVSEVFNITEKMVSLVSAVNNETADKFLESLNFDDNGNLSGTLNTENEA